MQDFEVEDVEMFDLEEKAQAEKLIESEMDSIPYSINELQASYNNFHKFETINFNSKSKEYAYISDNNCAKFDNYQDEFSKLNSCFAFQQGYLNKLQDKAKTMTAGYEKRSNYLHNQIYQASNDLREAEINSEAYEYLEKQEILNANKRLGEKEVFIDLIKKNTDDLQSKYQQLKDENNAIKYSNIQ